ncbi:MAG: hypothetical protein AB7O97_19190 [Planctomycetota bacterium]
MAAGFALAANAEAQVDVTFVRPQHFPSAISGLTLGYDESRGEGLLFGGISHSSPTSFDETWSWDGRGWRQRFPTVTPPARSSSCMVWDPHTKCVLMFGGTTGTVLLGDTWLWDGRDWHQRLVAGPSPRQVPQMAADPVRHRIVLFGGITNAGASDETWEWDGSQWLQRQPATRRPTARHSQAMAWNSVTGRVAMLGGRSWPSGWINLLPAEEWDGLDWIRIPGSIVGGSPFGFADAAAVPDAQGGGVKVYGVKYWHPVAQRSPEYGEWYWDGATLQVLPFGARPPLRTMHDSLIFDRQRAEMILYGGADLADPQRRDTFRSAFPSGSWNEALKYGGPGLGWHPIFAQVPWRDAFLYEDYNFDFWWQTDAGFEYLGHGPQYLGNNLPVVPFVDPLRRRIYAYYTQLGWLYELVGASWISIPQAQHNLPAGAGRLGSFNPTTGRFPFVDGAPTGQGLFEWDGSTVTLVSLIPGSQVPGGGVQYPEVAVDTDRGVVAVVGLRPGGGAVMHEWDGSTWTTTACPTTAYGFELGYMPGIGCLLTTTPFSGIWSWDGTQWTQLQPSRSLPSLVGGTDLMQMAYDRSRNRMRFLIQRSAVMFENFWDLQPMQLQITPTEPRPGDVLQCAVHSPAHAGQPWLLLMSQVRYPGIPLAGMQPDPYRVLPLGVDDLLLASLGTGLRGFLDPQGVGSTTLSIPRHPALVGTQFAAVAVSVAANAQLGLVSGPVDVYVMR